MNKIVLITGASSGVGLETSAILAKEGYRVYAGIRDISKKDNVLNFASVNTDNIIPIYLDVCDTGSIEKAVKTIFDAEGRIDVLINNAGAGIAKTTEHATYHDIKWIMDVNYFGVVFCSKAVIPIMRKQKGGHIINISSVGGLVGQPFNELYCAAKFAVEGYTESMATYLTDAFGINFSLVEPGGISTNFAKSAMEKTLGSSEIVKDDYYPILEKYINTRNKRTNQGDSQIYQTAYDVAGKILELTQSEKPAIRVRTSQWAEDFCYYKTSLDSDGHKQNKFVIKSCLGE